MRPAGSTKPLTPVFVERMSARRVSMERNEASTRWIHGSCESPYQESLVMFTSTSGAPASDHMRRTNMGMMSSLQIIGINEVSPRTKLVSVFPRVKRELCGNQARIEGNVSTNGI